MEVANELVDTFDDNGAPKGAKERASVHRDGDWHRCFHCLIVSGCGEIPRLVLQRRARRLVDYPGLIDVSVAGHLHAGETLADAAPREIGEELGIQIPFDSLRSLGEYGLVVRRDGFWSRELTDVFYVCHDRSSDSYDYDPGEVGSLVVVTLADAAELWSGTRTRARVTEFEKRHSFDHEVALGDFVNEPPDYWPWLARALGDALNRGAASPPK